MAFLSRLYGRARNRTEDEGQNSITNLFGGHDIEKSSSRPATFRGLRIILHWKGTRPKVNTRRSTEFTFSANDCSSVLHQESPDRNGIIHLQRRPKIADLRAASELCVIKATMRLRKKSRVEDLRAVAAAHSPTTPQRPIKILDIMVHNLDIGTTKTADSEKARCDTKHCSTCSCIPQAYIKMCDVCDGHFLPSGSGWTNWVMVCLTN